MLNISIMLTLKRKRKKPVGLISTTPNTVSAIKVRTTPTASEINQAGK
jgi:hypothetical protein